MNKTHHTSGTNATMEETGTLGQEVKAQITSKFLLVE